MKNWEKYELQIFKKLKNEFRDAKILKDQKIIGIYSKVERQIDILATGKFIGKEHKVIIDCKLYNKNIDVKNVESFIGMCEDVQANIGMLITSKGYSKAAKNRIQNYHRDIKLDVVEFDKLDEYSFFPDICGWCEPSSFCTSKEIDWGDIQRVKKSRRLISFRSGICMNCSTEYAECMNCRTSYAQHEFEDNPCECGNEFEIIEITDKKGMTEYELGIL